MPFDARKVPPRVAVIGGGVSGLAAAHFLRPVADVTLYEAEPRLGGHARTVLAGLSGERPVDTGFIVFNYATYPHLGRLFQQLDVPVVRSDMSFGVSIDRGRIEYALRSLPALFAQPRNTMRPGFLRMLRDIQRFNAAAEAAVAGDPSIGELVGELGLGDWFRRYYLVPICGAIWSTPECEIEAFPARVLLRFFRNHGLLGLNGQHQWWTVAGGSREYVRRLVRQLEAGSVRMLAGVPVAGVSRDGDSVTVHAVGRVSEQFDEVVLACHADQALRLIERPTAAESAALGAIRYRSNAAVLHRDPRQMPRRRACWSSWVYRADSQRERPGIGVTYWMNRLQNIPDEDPLFVTLNPGEPIPDQLVYDRTSFDHPVFDHAAIRAQEELAALQGANATWFVGAYLRHGFHEDGIASAMRVARQMRVTVR
jgi:predicted NAD/FAD-binding protein